MSRSARELHALAVDAATIDYHDQGGDGAPLLLVHAGVFSGWFEPLAADPALDGFRIIRIVRAGYSCGPAPTRHLSIADHAAHCAALLDALDVDHAHIVGHSSGSAIGLQLTLDRPDLVSSLILSEPPLLDDVVAPEDLDFVRTTIRPAIGAAVAAAARGDVATAFQGFMTALCGPDYATVLETALGPDGPSHAEQQSRFFFGDELPAAQSWRFDTPAAQNLRHPVLLVQGGASPPHVHRLITHLAAMIPTARTATIDNDNHLLPLRNPAALARLIAEFAPAGSRTRPATQPSSATP